MGKKVVEKKEVKPVEKKLESSVEVKKELQINGKYLTSRKTDLYDISDKKTVIDTIEENTPLTIKNEQEGAFVMVDYFGLMAYVKTEDLKN